MTRRIGFFACGAALALAMCSCSAQTERDRMIAEAVAAREAEARATEAAGREIAEGLKIRAEAMKRWSAAAAGVTVKGPDGAPIDFAWTDRDKFPHPSLKGGSAGAYGAFAGVLLAFLRSGDNFEFLAKNKLFKAELHYVPLDGKVSKWTFADLAEQLSQPGAPGTHDEATRKALKEFADKMKSPPKA
ncbi:MAG: hypothetical protein J0I06_24350 [Planctomycetes bacterium]|nr:hypothetical protein [Planctomycetota bacterium]